MEGMFLINIPPLSTHHTVGEYAKFLLKQYIVRHFRNSAREVHLIFDNEACLDTSPKYFERQHRDSSNAVPDDHFCTEFSQDLSIPPKWRSIVLNCRKCKRQLVCFLANFFLRKIKHRLTAGQKFVTGGGFDGDQSNNAYFVTREGSPTCDDTLSCNAEESDSRIWLHVLNSTGNNKLVLSPDTDVYLIGLPIVGRSGLDVMVRLSAYNSLQHRYLDMQALLEALKNDPELASLQPDLIPAVMQKLFICTGCDFVSFFTGYGKAAFFGSFFHYCEFITSGLTPTQPGTLVDDNPESEGYLAFLRLVGCTYFHKHKAAFLPSFPTPMTLFNSLPVGSQQQPQTHHEQWIGMIRDKIWSRIQYEDNMIPSCEALHRHWRRSC